MARGLQIINSDLDLAGDRQIPPDDLVLINAQRRSNMPEPVVEHPMQPLPSSQSSHPIAASNATVDHNANSSSSGSSNSQPDSLSAAGGIECESSDIIADYASETYASYLPPSARPLPSLQETRAAGQILFTQFCRQHVPAMDLEILEDAIPEQVPQDINQLMHRPAEATINGYTHPNLAAFGRDLRRIAEQFEKSKERDAIKKKAAEVNLESIGYEDFRSLVMDLFREGISREKIIVLFFFCSDLAFRSVTTGTATLCRQLFTWSIAFIMDFICDWVRRQGGWGVVLGEYVPKLAMTVCALLGCIAFSLYIKRCISSI